MNLKYIWWCNECEKEVSSPSAHVNQFPKHTYSQRMRWKGAPIVQEKAAEYDMNFSDGEKGFMEFKNTEWKSCATFVYDGVNFKPAKKLKFCAWVDEGGSGLVRLYDITNNVELGIAQVFSSKATYYEVDLNDLPKEHLVLSVQFKSNSSSKRIKISHAKLI